MSKGLFITGTDTEIGKTFVSQILVRSLVNRGLRVAVMKPVASGAQLINGQLRNDDALQLLETANVKSNYELVNPYCFEPAIAPHIAAQQLGQKIELSVIKQCFDELSMNSDIVVVEGVGGWSVPLSDKEMLSNLVDALNLPVLLVAGIRLGCINHTLLTAEAIRSNGNTLLGWIANQIDPQMDSIKENIEAIQQRINLPLRSDIPRINQVSEKLEHAIDITFLDC